MTERNLVGSEDIIKRPAREYFAHVQTSPLVATLAYGWHLKSLRATPAMTRALVFAVSSEDPPRCSELRQQ